jgi:hypothetical protein
MSLSGEIDFNLRANTLRADATVHTRFVPSGWAPNAHTPCVVPNGRRANDVHRLPIASARRPRRSHDWEAAE